MSDIELSQLKKSLLLAPTVRSRAYVQAFNYFGLSFDNVVLLPANEPDMSHLAVFDTADLFEKFSFSFDPNEPIEETCKKAGYPIQIGPNCDVNSEGFVDFLKGMSPHLFGFSGMPGCLLRHAILKESGHSFLHAHGGDAPRYAGSTTFYYSFLERGDIGATAFIMEEGIDTGDVVTRLNVKPPFGVDFDNILDPLVRAFCLCNAFDLISQQSMKAVSQDHKERQTYFIIHPLLRHLAMQKNGLIKS